MMAFNSEEDLILLSSEGTLIIIDIFIGSIKSKNTLPNFRDKVTAIEEAQIVSW